MQARTELVRWVPLAERGRMVPPVLPRQHRTGSYGNGSNAYSNTASPPYTPAPAGPAYNQNPPMGGSSYNTMPPTPSYNSAAGAPGYGSGGYAPAGGASADYRNPVRPAAPYGNSDPSRARRRCHRWRQWRPVATAIARRRLPIDTAAAADRYGSGSTDRYGSPAASSAPNYGAGGSSYSADSGSPYGNASPNNSGPSGTDAAALVGRRYTPIGTSPPPADNSNALPPVGGGSPPASGYTSGATNYSPGNASGTNYSTTGALQTLRCRPTQTTAVQFAPVRRTPTATVLRADSRSAGRRQ